MLLVALAAGCNGSGSAGELAVSAQRQAVAELCSSDAQCASGFTCQGGRCHSAAQVVWFDDALPAGASLPGCDQAYNWTMMPPPFSGTRANAVAPVAGLHQACFAGATATMAVGALDRLFAYVYLDPVNPPREVMLQWHDGSSWEHRAYWGENLIAWGGDGTTARRYVGPLPTARGQWVRLEVYAQSVGLVNLTVSGMAFTLYDGAASFDRVGKVGGTIGTRCGDGVVDPGEQCDLGSANGLTTACCSATCQNRPVAAFGDVPAGSTYEDSVRTLACKGITSGCAAGSFCPTSTLTRVQLAVFLMRAKYPGEFFTYTATPWFPDDVPATHPFFKYVQKMKDDGITNGCATNRFCPDDPLRKDVAAIFIMRGKYQPAGQVPECADLNHFPDVPAGSFGYREIQRLFHDVGAPAYCTGSSFCPTDNITRLAFAKWVDAAFGLKACGNGRVDAGEACDGASCNLTCNGALTNWAALGTAQQSSNYSATEYLAAAVIDGNASLFSHTAYQYQPWWRVDLGALRRVSAIKLWNGQECCQERLADYWIDVDPDDCSFDNSTRVADVTGTPAGKPSTFTFSERTARCVRVMLKGSNYLHPGEVEVLGPSSVPQCTSGDCCDAATLTYQLAGSVCRAAVRGECDAAETCSGVDSTCPADVNRPDGTLCTDTIPDNCYTAACQSGYCNQYAGQCLYKISGSAGTTPGVLYEAVPGPPPTGCVGDGCTCPGGEPPASYWLGNDDGSYVIGGYNALLPACNRDYTVTPQRWGCSFTPTSQTVAGAPNRTNVNFTASCSPYSSTISGNVGVQGALIAIAGVDRAVSDANGNYEIKYCPLTGTQTVTVSRYECTFSPSARYVNLPGNHTGINFTSSCTTLYQVSGNAGVGGATITAASRTTTAAANGSYTLSLPYGFHTLVPSKPGYTFSPASKVVEVPPSSSGHDFVAYGCGDGIRQGTEQCDNGASNGSPTSCCTTSCTYRPAGTVCGTGVCDQCNATGTCVVSDTACFKDDYHVTDPLGSVVATVDSSNALVCREGYLPYGAEHSATGTCAELKFNGKPFDQGTGLLYYGGRYYDPDTARFLSFDLVAGNPKNPQSHHRYAYVLNNPYRYVDPTGHAPVSPQQAAGMSYQAQQTYTTIDFHADWWNQAVQAAKAENQRTSERLAQGKNVVGYANNTGPLGEEGPLFGRWNVQNHPLAERVSQWHDALGEWADVVVGRRLGLLVSRLTVIFPILAIAVDEMALGESAVQGEVACANCATLGLGGSTQGDRAAVSRVQVPASPGGVQSPAAKKVGGE
jgi:RHS repeat-associated protein